MANMNQPIRLRLRRCAYTNRGCTATVRQEALLSHYEECCFAPVQCSHEGCQVTVNRQDVINHQQNCEFRSVTCEECDEAVKQKDYDRHSCVLQRKVAELTRILQEFQGGQSPANQPHATREQPGNNLIQPEGQLPTPQAQQGAGIFQFETTQVEQVVTRRFAGQVVGQPNSTFRPQGNGFQLATPSMSSGYFRASSISNPAQLQSAGGKEIVVAGGVPYLQGNKSYEVFNWSTQQWTLHENTLFFDHTDGFSFFYDNKVMFCGGTKTNRVECLDIANYRSVFALPVQLPGVNCGKGALCGDKILTFGESVSETYVRNSSHSVRVRYDNKRQFSNYGITRVNDKAVLVVGGDNAYTRIKYDEWYLEYDEFEKKEYADEVALYYPSTNVMKTLAPLPYGLRNTTVVAHGENIIILGGEQSCGQKSNEVLMYNITNQYCSKLPNMLEKRSSCAAVIIGDTIVVFGGHSPWTHEKLNTAEYLVLGENTWKRLPPMHYKRAGATACVLS